MALPFHGMGTFHLSFTITDMYGCRHMGKIHACALNGPLHCTVVIVCVKSFFSVYCTYTPSEIAAFPFRQSHMYSRFTLHFGAGSALVNYYDNEFHSEVLSSG